MTTKNLKNIIKDHVRKKLTTLMKTGHIPMKVVLLFAEYYMLLGDRICLVFC